MELVEEYTLGNGEMGLRAAVTIPTGTLIGIFDGVIRAYEVVDGRLTDPNAYSSIVQIRMEDGVLFGMTTEEEFHGIDYVNHSCDSNILVQNQTIMIAARDIRVGEPLLTDYRKWDFIAEGLDCWCAPSNCVI
jgi:SET domain